MADDYPIRAKLRSGQPTIGSWMQIPDANVAALMARGGFDWIALDLEHGRFAEDALPTLFRIIASAGSLPMARLGRVNAYAIKVALDAGARGVILPMIESADQLRDAIAAALYPPHGKRGIGFSAANGFGRDFADGLNAAPPLIVAQIEHIKAVNVIDELVQVPGLDAVMIGPYDLSASMGLTGQFDHADFIAAQNAVIAACRRHLVASGLHVVMPEPERLRTAIANGHRFIAYGIDSVFLWTSAVIPAVV